MSQELRNGILAALRANGRLADKKIPIWETVGRGAQMPYIELGEESVEDAGADHGPDRVDGFTTQIGVHCWSRQADAPRCREMTKAVRDALHENEEIAVVGHRVCSVLHVTTQYPPDPDANVEHGVVMFEIITETI